MKLSYKIKISRKYGFRAYLSKILLVLFLLNTIFLPADTFSIKILSLILLLAINCDCIFRMRTKVEQLVVLFGFGLTSYNILMSILYTGDIYKNVSMGYPGYILLLYPIIVKYNVNIIKIANKILLFMAYFIVIAAMLDIIGILPIYSNPLLMWMRLTDNAYIGKGSHLVIGICLFLKATPMLLLAIPQFLKEQKYVSAVVLLIALILSGTRANIFTAIVVFVFGFIFHKKNSIRVVLLICIIAGIGMMILLEGSVIDIIVDMFALKAGSDMVRSNHLGSILNLWRENPLSLITGTGFSSQFFSLGHNSMTDTIELSYWNLLRQVGIIPFLLMMYMYFLPVKMLFKKNNTIAIAYVGYMLVAYTNPLLYSSTGMTLLLLVYLLTYREDKIS